MKKLLCIWMCESVSTGAIRNLLITKEWSEKTMQKRVRTWLLQKNNERKRCKKDFLTTGQMLHNY